MLCLALAGVFLAIERLLQKPQAELTGLDRMIGYLLLGRFFSRLHARAQERGYAFSPAVKRGVFVLLGIGTLLAAISLGGAR